MSKPTPLSEVTERSLLISTQTCSVRIDDSAAEVDRTYLKLQGTPEGFRWLAQHLQSLAKSAEKHETPCGNILAPADFENRPVQMEGWDALEFCCSK